MLEEVGGKLLEGKEGRTMVGFLGKVKWMVDWGVVLVLIERGREDDCESLFVTCRARRFLVLEGFMRRAPGSRSAL